MEVSSLVRRSLQKFYTRKLNTPRVYVGRLGDISFYRKKDGYRVLVSDVSLETGEPITDHLWIRSEVLPQTRGLTIGDIIRFSGTVQNYRKEDGSMDFGIDVVQESFAKGVMAG